MRPVTYAQEPVDEGDAGLPDDDQLELSSPPLRGARRDQAPSSWRNLCGRAGTASLHEPLLPRPAGSHDVRQ